MARPAGIVIDGQGIERRPTVVMAPLRDFAQKLTHRSVLNVADRPARTDLHSRSDKNLCSGLLCFEAPNLVVIKQRLGKLLSFGTHRMLFFKSLWNQSCWE